MFLHNRSMRQTVFKNFFWLSFGQIAGRFIRAAIIIYAARALGAAEYGVFSYALSLAAFFAVFSDVGVNSILTKEISRNPEKEQEYFSTAFWLKAFLVGVSALAVIFLAPYFSKIEGAKILMPIIALLIIFGDFRDFSLTFFRAKEKMEGEAFISIVTNLLITVSGFVILYYFATAKALTFSYVLSSGAGLIIAFFILRKRILKVVSHFDKSLLKPIINSALPIALVATFSAFLINIDMLMLGWIGTSMDVGLYAAPQKIVQFLSIFPGIIASTVFPVISRLIGQNEKEKIKSIAERTITAVMIAAFPIAVGGVVLGKSIIGFIFGNEYIAATLAFQILIVTVLASFPSPFFSNLILAYDKQKRLVGYTIGFSLLNVVLNALLIKRFGIAGASFATLVSTFLLTGALWYIMKEINRLNLLRHLGKIAITSILMGFLAFFLDRVGIQVIANIIISGGVYLLLLHLFKENTLNELKMIVKSVKL